MTVTNKNIMITVTMPNTELL